MSVGRFEALGLIDIQHYLRPGLLQLQSLPPLSLYIHLPWCVKKCPYCDFNSHTVSNLHKAPNIAAVNADLPATTQTQYLGALLADLDAALPLIWGRTVHSIFLGGGTPSLFDPEQISELVSQVRARLRLSADCEITMEANPGTFEIARFKAFAQAGITRLSIGVQSFNDKHLKALGRIHNSSQAKKALESASSLYSSFNIDLMYALPTQTAEELETDLKTALSFDPPHLSVYHLTIEPNTTFAKYPPPIPDDDTAYAMLDTIIARTADAGLARYEVSAFSKPNHQAWHNLNYWQFGDYLGIGAGAHSKLSFAHRIVRQARVRDPQSYMQKLREGATTGSTPHISEERDIPHKELAFEFMLNALRLKDGVPLDYFKERTGLGVNALAKGLKAAQDKGLMTTARDRLQTTDTGFDFLSDVQEMFLNG